MSTSVDAKSPAAPEGQSLRLSLADVGALTLKDLAENINWQGKPDFQFNRSAPWACLEGSEASSRQAPQPSTAEAPSKAKSETEEAVDQSSSDEPQTQTPPENAKPSAELPPVAEKETVSSSVEPQTAVEESQDVHDTAEVVSANASMPEASLAEKAADDDIEAPVSDSETASTSPGAEAEQATSGASSNDTLSTDEVIVVETSGDQTQIHAAAENLPGDVDNNEALPENSTGSQPTNAAAIHQEPHESSSSGSAIIDPKSEMSTDSANGSTIADEPTERQSVQDHDQTTVESKTTEPKSEPTTETITKSSTPIGQTISRPAPNSDPSANAPSQHQVRPGHSPAIDLTSRAQQPVPIARPSSARSGAEDDYLAQLEQLVLDLNLELARVTAGAEANNRQNATDVLVRRVIDLSLENYRLRAGSTQNRPVTNET